MKLTEKETKLLKAFGEGMDSPNQGWLHEMGDGSHSEAGVLGSLIEKGLVTSLEEKEPGMATCYWIEVTEEGQKALAEIGEAK